MIDSGSASDDGRAQIAQEGERDDDGERRALDQRLHGRIIIAEFVADLGVDLGELLHLRVVGLDLGEPLLDELIDGDVACALSSYPRAA